MYCILEVEGVRVHMDFKNRNIKSFCSMEICVHVINILQGHIVTVLAHIRAQISRFPV